MEYLFSIIGCLVIIGLGVHLLEWGHLIAGGIGLGAGLLYFGYCVMFWETP